MVKNSDSDLTKTQTLSISQSNEESTKNGYIPVGTLIKANTPMRPPDNKSMDTYFEPSDSLENKTIEESLDYGNTSCLVFKRGIQNEKDFCQKINMPERNF